MESFILGVLFFIELFTIPLGSLIGRDVFKNKKGAKVGGGTIDFLLVIVILIFLIHGCTPIPVSVPTYTPTSLSTATPNPTPAPTNTPTPSSTATSIPTPKPTNTPAPSSTATPNPTPTSTPIPVSLAYKPVPRWMIINQPFNNVEILGEIWNYTNDRWGDAYACIDYKREEGIPVNFEQCFALVYDETVSFESQRDLFLGDGFEELTPKNTFDNTGQIALLGKRLSGNANNVIEFFEIVGIGNYVALIELYIELDDNNTLQATYEKHVAAIMDYVLQDSLQKSHLIPRPTATPLSPTQENFYTTLGNKLITELEANTLYAGSWESLGDFIDPENPMVCRDFEDRTNADVLWVGFSDCIILPHPDFDFDSYAEGIKSLENVVLLESAHHYKDKFILYGKFKGHTYFRAYMFHGEYLYYVQIESRTIGEAKVENMYTQEVDDFVYAVLMTNADK